MKTEQEQTPVRLLGLLAITCTLLLSGSSFAAEPTKPVKVFLFAGQSNMEGADAHPERIDDFPMFKGAGAPQVDVLYCCLAGQDQEAFKGWGPLQPLRSFGSELTFARMLKRHDDSPIAIIKSAVGGTTVAYDWNPEAPDQGQKLYPRTLKLIQESLKELDTRGVRYRLEGVMWHQGENDTYFGPYQQKYAAWMKDLIAQVRLDLKQPALPWFISEQHPRAIWKNIDAMNSALNTMAKSEQQVFLIPTARLPHARLHFGTQGTLLLGEETAEAYLKTQR